MKLRSPHFKVLWNPSHKPGEGKKLSELDVKKGSWEFSSVFRDTVVAHEWNITPSEFWSKESEEQALMIAFIETRNSMDTIDSDTSINSLHLPPSTAGIKR